MSFSTEISYYAGSTGGHTAQVNKYVQNGIQWVISQIEKTNPDLLSLFAKIQTLNNSAPTLTLSTNSKILDVVRDSADTDGEDLKCSPINPAFRSNAVNVDSIYFAGPNSPVYYILNGVLTVLPTPTANQTAKISIVLPDTTADGTSTNIDNFPSEMYHAVVLYSAAQLIHHKMIDMRGDLPSDLDADTTVFDAIANLNQTLSVSTSLPTWNTTKALPSSITLASSLPADFSVDTNLPTLTISSDYATDLADALNKAKRLIDDASNAEGDSAATMTSAQGWLADEDEDMVAATLSTAAQELQRANSIMQKFQADINKEVQQFTGDMQTYQAEIQEEQAKANAAAQKVNTEIASDSTIASTDVSIYQAELQKEQTRFNAEINNYTSELSKVLQIANYELSEFNANIQKNISLYTTIIGKLTTDYQWLQGQYQTVKQELAEFMAPYTMAGALDSTVEGVKR